MTAKSTLSLSPTNTDHANTPTLTMQTSVSGSLSPKNDTDNYIDHTLKKIARLMHSWLSPKIDRAPCNITGLALSHPPSPPPPVNPPDHETYNYELHLDRIAAKVDQMHRHWPSTSAEMPTAATNPRPTMNKRSARCNSSSMHPMLTTNFQQTPVIILAFTMQVTTHPAPTATTTFVELPQHRTTAGDDSDPSLLAAVQSLDNFLLKYPRPNDSDAPYQPSPNRQQLPSCHDRFTQQTQVLCTVNVLLGKLNNKLSRFIDALSGFKKYTIDMQPKVLPRTPCNPALAAPRLPTNTVRTSQHSIPAKTPFPHFHRNLTLHRTKANLCPP